MTCKGTHCAGCSDHKGRVIVVIICLAVTAEIWAHLKKAFSSQSFYNFIHWVEIVGYILGSLVAITTGIIIVRAGVKAYRTLKPLISSWLDTWVRARRDDELAELPTVDEDQDQLPVPNWPTPLPANVTPIRRAS